MRCYFCPEVGHIPVSLNLGSGITSWLTVCQSCADKQIAITVKAPTQESALLEALGELAIRQLRQGEIAELKASNGAVVRVTRLDRAAFGLSCSGVEALVLYRGVGEAPVPVACTASRSSPGLIAGRYNLARGSIEHCNSARLRACRTSTLQLLAPLADNKTQAQGLQLCGFKDSAAEAA